MNTYLHTPTGVGSTTPAVYTACQIFLKLTLLVTSLIRTGAILLCRSFLWAQRKLISVAATLLKVVIGLNEGINGSSEFDPLFADLDIHRDAGDEGDEFMVARDADADMPVSHVSRRCQRPASETAISVQACLIIDNGAHHRKNSLE